MSTSVISRNLEDDNYVWDTNTLAWVKMTQPGAASSVVVTSIVTGQGRTLQYMLLNEAPGTTVIANSIGGQSAKLVSYVIVMTANGTCKFVNGSGGPLSGPMSFVANSGVAAISNVSTPLIDSGVGSGLQLVITGGTANGHLVFFQD